jgi:hypothetical protein
MAENLSKTDFEIILNLAEYRLMTVSQLAFLYPRSERLLRSKLKEFAETSLVHTDLAPSVGKKGRPSDIYGVGKAGYKLLKSKRKLDPGVPFERVNIISPHSRSHMMAVNDFRIQLVKTARIAAELEIKFLSPNSPFTARINDEQTIISEQFAVNTSENKWVRYTPDGVFVIHCSTLKKTLLFFLELDMATESLASRKGYKNNIREKILNYQLTYKLEQYKRYESVFGSKLNGFRLLLVTKNSAHLPKLEKLLSEMPPSKFIHTTDIETISTRGLWSPVWHKGGRLDLRPVSILGSKTPKNAAESEKNA